MNHKRKRPKNRRAGCLLCKPHKQNGLKSQHRLRNKEVTKQERRDALGEMTKIDQEIGMT